MTKTIYLDQNHLSNLAKPGSEPLRQRFLAFLKEAKVQVAISYPHILETSTIDARMVLGRVVFANSPLVDAIRNLVEEMPMVKMWSAFEIKRREFLGAAKAFWSERPITPLDPFGKWEFFGMRAREMSFRAEVARVRLTPSIIQQYWQTAGATAKWRDSIKTQESPPPEATFRDLFAAEMRATVKMFLKDEGYSTHWPHGMSGTDRQQFTETFNASQCPALALYVALSALDRAERGKDGRPRRSRANDLIDLQAASAATTYCEAFITERSLADQIKQVRKHHDFLGPPKALVFADLDDYLGGAE